MEVVLYSPYGGSPCGELVWWDCCCCFMQEHIAFQMAGWLYDPTLMQVVATKGREQDNYKILMQRKRVLKKSLQTKLQGIYSILTT
jgi:hypothetical protein